MRKVYRDGFDDPDRLPKESRAKEKSDSTYRISRTAKKEKERARKKSFG